MKRYNLVNNTLGWLCFVIAAATYLLTLEPTASFWDCPEFITQGYKLEVGHPPGNPIFMLTARFFVTLFGGSAQNAALAVNTMSALLSAGTILLLFWTVTHLIRRLIVRDDSSEISLRKTVIIMAGGLCGALAYTWSDTFWFSAVEGEVYAFSSFCTALVFWLILKWENRADAPHSDRYIILIAYVIGISIAVHLLNLLCIPAIVLVFYYKKFKNPTVIGSLIALAVSAALVVLILYGLVPGFIAVAQRFELLFVNSFHMNFNSGVIAYVILTVITFLWTIIELYRQRSAWAIRIGVFLSVIFSGMPFIGHGWLIPFVLISGLAVYLFAICRKIPVRVFNVAVISVFVIFIGYSSYALLLIRSNAVTPMNQNSPDNVFSLASYLNREQYGDRPLLYGQTVAEELGQPQFAGYDDQDAPIWAYEIDDEGYPVTSPITGLRYQNGMPIDVGENAYAKEVKTDPSDPDRYVKEVHRPEYEYSADIKMLLPRIYSSDPRHVKNYKSWSLYVNQDFEEIPSDLRRRWLEMGYAPEKELTPYLNNTQTFDMGTYSDRNGDEVEYAPEGWKMGLGPNLRFFFNYQLNHMYWRYFMWNFAGRQNDLQGNGEPHMGNWISGIPFIDNARLGDQSLLPEEYGEGNKGHNVFYMLPLILGLIGLLWQALARHTAGPRRGIEQFWVVFFLFFMTGIAIVLYLNQTPGQPRERDYAFAGSFYAFAIWIGLGVPAIVHILKSLVRLCTGSAPRRDRTGAVVTPDKPLGNGLTWAIVAVAVLIGLAVPLQMVSQTWDDHDRSDRYTARDFGMNYLNSLDDNAIIFTNGDNDTFPLWYAQEVEGVRPDVKVVNLSYLSTDWYANQLRRPSYTAAGIPMYASPEDYAYEKFWMRSVTDETDSMAMQPITAERALTELYSHTSPATQRLLANNPGSYTDVKYVLATPNIYVPLDSVATRKAFGRLPETFDVARGGYFMPLSPGGLGRSAGLSRMLTYDIVAHSAGDGWKRPVYFANTVPSDMYIGLNDYLFNTGMAKQVAPFRGGTSPVADKAYRNIMSRFRWGGLDSGKDIYLDETVHRMISSTRLAVLDVAKDLLDTADAPASAWAVEYAGKKNEPVPVTHLDMARRLVRELDTRMPEQTVPYENYIDMQRAEILCAIWALSGKDSDLKAAREALDECIERYGALLRYAASVDSGTRKLLGSDTRQSLSFVNIAIGMRNYLDLRKAMMDKGADAESLSVLDSTANSAIGQYVYRWLFLDDYDAETLLKFYNTRSSQVSDLAGYAYEIKEMYRQYLPGVKPMSRTEKVASRLGVSLPEWRRIAD